MPPKTKAQGTSKKADAKKKERVIEVSCIFLLAQYYKQQTFVKKNMIFIKILSITFVWFIG